MKDLQDFFDNPGLSHIGEQIVRYFDVDDLWNLRQVSKHWKTVADLHLKRQKAYYDSMLDVQVLYPFNWRNLFWKKRGVINFIKFHDFYKKWFKEHQQEFDQRTRYYFDLFDHKTKGISMEWPVRDENIELLKILLPGCPNAAGTQEDNEPDLIQFAEMACRITNNVDIINVFLNHCNKIKLRKDKCVQAGFVSACGAGHEAVVKRLIEVSEEDRINLSMTIIPDIQIQGEIGLTETTFPGKLNIVKILLEASRDKKVDLTHKNSFDLEIIEYLTEAMRIEVKEK